MIEMKDGNGIINIPIRDDHNEALLQWSENLAALGRTLRWVNEHPDKDNALPDIATELGYIIEDYAKMISHVCHQAYGTIGKFFREERHTLVSRAKERCAMLKESSHVCRADIDTIDRMIEEMKPALTDAIILKELLGEFEKIKKAREQKLNPENHMPKTNLASAEAASAG